MVTFFFFFGSMLTRSVTSKHRSLFFHVCNNLCSHHFCPCSLYLFARMSSPGGGCRLQTCRWGNPQLFNSAFLVVNIFRIHFAFPCPDILSRVNVYQSQFAFFPQWLWLQTEGTPSVCNCQRAGPGYVSPSPAGPAHLSSAGLHSLAKVTLCSTARVLLREVEMDPVKIAARAFLGEPRCNHRCTPCTARAQFSCMQHGSSYHHPRA